VTYCIALPPNGKHANRIIKRRKKQREEMGSRKTADKGRKQPTASTSAALKINLLEYSVRAQCTVGISKVLELAAMHNHHLTA